MRGFNAFIPILVLIAALGVSLIALGEGSSLTRILETTDPYKSMMYASFVGVLVAAALSIGQKILTVHETIDAWYGGLRATLFGMVILVLAWSLSDVTAALNTAAYLVTLLADSLPVALIPALVFILAAITAFTTGTSWGTMAILMPLIIPLSWAVMGVNGIADESGMHIHVLVSGLLPVRRRLGRSLLADLGYDGTVVPWPVAATTSSTCARNCRMRCSLGFVGPGVRHDSGRLWPTRVDFSARRGRYPRCCHKNTRTNCGDHLMSVSRPLIGVPADRIIQEEHPFHQVGEKYIRAITDCVEGVPLLIPVLAEHLELDELLAAVDGVLFTGSPSDVEPHHYGGEPTGPDANHDPHRDAMTLPMAQRALAQGIPVFAICRGFQELNVVAGGTLHQDVKRLPGVHWHDRYSEFPRSRST